METKEAWHLTLVVFICCLAVFVRADAEDDIAFSAGESDITKFGQAKSVRYVNQNRETFRKATSTSSEPCELRALFEHRPLNFYQ